MDDKVKVFLLQDTAESCEELKAAINSESNLEVIYDTTDAISAIPLIAEKRPDVVITELVLKGYDGLCVIDKVRSMNKNVKIVVLSSLCSEDAVKSSVSAGADYFIAKPLSASALKDVIINLRNKEQNKRVSDSYELHRVTLEEKISKIFINVGIPPHIKGYAFLREGVKMAVEDPNVINNITKQLYPMIGEKYNTTPSKVERAIRHAIEVAWNRGRIENINNILGVRAYVGTEKPTNGEFIALIADKMLLEGANAT